MTVIGCDQSSTINTSNSSGLSHNSKPCLGNMIYCWNRVSSLLIHHVQEILHVNQSILTGPRVSSKLFSKQDCHGPLTRQKWFIKCPIATKEVIWGMVIDMKTCTPLYKSMDFLCHLLRSFWPDKMVLAPQSAVVCALRGATRCWSLSAATRSCSWRLEQGILWHHDLGLCPPGRSLQFFRWADPCVQPEVDRFVAASNPRLQLSIGKRHKVRLCRGNKWVLKILYHRL